MAKTVTLYTLDELQGHNDGIIIRTQSGVEVYVFVKDGKTFVLFPMGNELTTAEAFGHLSVGVVASSHQ